MSKNSLILERAASQNSRETPPPLVKETRTTGEFLDLIRHLRDHPVIAVVNSGSGVRGAEACRGIAAELAASGNRVVIVEVAAVLRMDPLPDPTACLPGRVPNVSLWPSAAGASPVEFFQSAAPPPSAGNWLGGLRRRFDSVLLDCPSVETAPGAAGIAVMADAAVLVVEAGRTTKQQIQHDQQALQLRGIALAGCILMRRRQSSANR